MAEWLTQCHRHSHSRVAPCGRTMSVHDVCTERTLYAGGCLRSISMVSIGRHPNWGTQPHSARLGHPSRLKIDTLARPFCKEVFAMDILAESRFTFRQGHTVQPFAMVSGNHREGLDRTRRVRRVFCLESKFRIKLNRLRDHPKCVWVWVWQGRRSIVKHMIIFFASESKSCSGGRNECLWGILQGNSW